MVLQAGDSTTNTLVEIYNAIISNLDKYTDNRFVFCDVSRWGRWGVQASLKDVRSCVLRTFLDRSSFSKILHHISFLLVNFGLTMSIKLYSNKKIAKKFQMINIRWGTMFYSGSFSFIRKFIFFLFWCVNSIVHLNSHFSMQAA